MTAPGQEPDEVLTSTPGGRGTAADKPDLDAIGDNHMPDDLRRAEAERGESDKAEAEVGPEAADEPEEGSTEDSPEDSTG